MIFDTDKLAPPYDTEALIFSRQQLGKLDGKCVSPKALEEFKREEKITLPFEHTHVVRRRDVLDLFDTSPDLSGNEIDIQRFVRGDDPETDVQVFWRTIPTGGPEEDELRRAGAELCNVPVGQARTFLDMLAEKKRGAAYTWDHLDEEWGKLDSRRLRPGLTILLPAWSVGMIGTMNPGLGKVGTLTAQSLVVPVDGESEPEEATGSDRNSALGGPPLTIQEHTENVCRELDDLLKIIGRLIPEWRDRLRNRLDGTMSERPTQLSKPGCGGRIRARRKQIVGEIGEQ